MGRLPNNGRTVENKVRQENYFWKICSKGIITDQNNLPLHGQVVGGVIANSPKQGTCTIVVNKFRKQKTKKEARNDFKALDRQSDEASL